MTSTRTVINVPLPGSNLLKHLRTPLGQVLILLALGAVHVLLYLVFVPPWQFPDEPRHFEYVRLYADLGRRPYGRDRDPALEEAIVHSMAQFDFWRFGFASVNYVPESPPRFRDLWGAAYAHALFQPPLYYALTRYAIQPFLQDSLIPQLYAARLFSWLVAVFNLVLIYFIGYALGKHRLGTLMLLFAALLPGHAFINAAVINDVLAELWVLFALLAGIVLLVRGWHPVPLGILLVSVFLGLLTKRTTLVTVPWTGYVLLYLLITTVRRHHRLRLWLVGTVFVAALVVGAAFVYVWQQGLIGLPRDAWEKLITGIYWQEAKSLPWGRYFHTLFTSFWGHFGWLNVPLPSVVYVILLLMTGGALGGWVVHWYERVRDGRLWTPGVIVGLGLILSVLVQWGLVFGKEIVYAYFGGQSLPQGRYLYPLLPAYALFYLIGWRPWLQRVRVPEGLFWSLGLLLLATYALFHLLNTYYTILP